MSVLVGIAYPSRVGDGWGGSCCRCHLGWNVGGELVVCGWAAYRWKRIHCEAVTILSCVSFSELSFALKASSDHAIVAEVPTAYCLASTVLH